MAKLTDITKYLEGVFNYHSFKDSALNGLQVEAGTEVRKIGASVDCGISIVEKAIKEDVDLLISHHGIFWGQEGPITGPTASKLKLMLANNISLIGIHLPLDAHPEFGNNAILAAKVLKLDKMKPSIGLDGIKIGFQGENTSQLTLDDLCERLSKMDGSNNTQRICLPFGPSTPKTVCAVSGAAADALFHYKSEGFDTLITGEPRQFAYHFCKENGLNAIFAGHYATETFGVKSICQHLADKFSIDWTFIGEPTGI